MGVGAFQPTLGGASTASSSRQVNVGADDISATGRAQARSRRCHRSEQRELSEGSTARESSSTARGTHPGIKVGEGERADASDVGGAPTVASSGLDITHCKSTYPRWRSADNHRLIILTGHFHDDLLTTFFNDSTKL